MTLKAQTLRDNHHTERFAAPPWDEQSEEWLRLDERLPDDHLARRIEEVVGWLELSSLRESFAGVGKPPRPPEVLVKIGLYEMHSQRLRPAQMATSQSGLLRQKETYDLAEDALRERLEYNDRQRSSKRKLGKSFCDGELLPVTLPRILYSNGREAFVPAHRGLMWI